MSVLTARDLVAAWSCVTLSLTSTGKRRRRRMVVVRTKVVVLHLWLRAAAKLGTQAGPLRGALRGRGRVSDDIKYTVVSPGRVGSSCGYGCTRTKWIYTAARSSQCGNLGKAKKIWSKNCKSNFWTRHHTDIVDTISRQHRIARIVQAGGWRWNGYRPGPRRCDRTKREHTTPYVLARRIEPLCANPCAVKRLWRPVRSWGGLTVTFFFSGCQVGRLRLAIQVRPRNVESVFWGAFVSFSVPGPTPQLCPSVDGQQQQLLNLQHS